MLALGDTGQNLFRTSYSVSMLEVSLKMKNPSMEIHQQFSQLIPCKYVTWEFANDMFNMFMNFLMFQ